MPNIKLIPSNNILEQALNYADLGWKVFPLIANEKTPYLPWSEAATTDKEQITRWWTDNPNNNIAVMTGVDSGLVVLDVDNKNGDSGSDTLVDLKVMDTLDTIAVETPSDGLHFYFKHLGEAVKNSAGFEPGLDLRGDGGYVVAPPSIFNGKQYKWAVTNKTLPDLPSWIPTNGKKGKSKKTATQTKSKKKKTTSVANTSNVIQQGSRNDTLFKYACSCRQKNCEYEEAIILLVAKNEECTPPLDDDELMSILESAYGYSSNKTYELNDLGNSKRLLDNFGEDFKYLNDVGNFLIWKDDLWKLDLEALEMLEKCKHLIPIIESEADAANDYNEDYAKKLRAFADRTSSVKNLKAPIELVKHASSIESSILDKNDYLFAVKDGCVDLKTGRFRSREKGDYITIASDVAYDKEATCDTWVKFINEIMKEDAEMIEYLQKIAGYLLTGDTKEQCFFIFYGRGANGKSTFVNTLNEILKSYAVSIPNEVLMSNKNSNGNAPNAELLKLKGKRMVETGELPEFRAFNESLLKQMTGGDLITARGMYAKNPISFNPKFKLIMVGNHKPYIKGLDHGFWRRTHVVPFDNTIPKEKIDKSLQEKLSSELSGILNWAIEGCLKWQQEGLEQPEKVKKAAEDYKQEQDYIGEWIADCCIEVDSSKYTIGQELFHNYDEWCNSHNESRLTARTLYKKLEEKGFVKVRQGEGNVIYGLWLKVEHDDSGIKKITANKMFEKINNKKKMRNVVSSPPLSEQEKFDRLLALKRH